MKNSFFARRAKLVVAVTLLLVPLVVFGASEALRNKSNSVRQWLPDGFSETRQYDWFVEHFGSEEMAVISWPGATFDDERITRVVEGLAEYTVPEPAGVSEGAGEQGEAGPYWFRDVTSGPEAVKRLMSPPLKLSSSEVLRRLQGTLIGPDGRTTGIVVTISEQGAADRHAVLETVYEVAEQQGGLARDELRLGGPTVDSVALDSESARSRYTLSTLSVCLALILAWRCLKRVNLVVTVFANALLCGAISLAWVHFLGGTMNLVMVTMPTLVYVLSISGAIHLTNYYREEAAQRGLEGAAERALAAGWLPCTLTGVTTAIGLGSLAVSKVVPVSAFGTYAALGVLSSLPVLFLFLPAAWTLWPLRQEDSLKDKAPRVRTGHGTTNQWTMQLAETVSRYHAPLTLAGVAVMLLAIAGLFRLETSVKLLNLFSPDSRIIKDYSWLEENLGPLVPVEIVLEMDRDSPLSALDRLALVTEVQRELESLPKVDGTMSPATFAPPIPEGGGWRQVTQRSLLNKKLETELEEFAGSHYVGGEGARELWRVSARVEALNSLDYGQFISTLRERVEPVLKNSRSGDTQVEAVYTGIVPLVYKAQRVLLNDLLTSFLYAFGLIGVVMVLTLRRLRAGLLSMLPNSFPAIVIFGGMSWTGRVCDIGSMMTASVALGIAVDDTIHFLSWFRRGLDRGMSRTEAISWAYHHCAGAMVQTTIICGVGMLGFALSSFVPTARFASLMIAMLGAALVGDLLFLPAMLAGPLGRWFEKSPKRQRVAKPEAAMPEPMRGTARPLVTS